VSAFPGLPSPVEIEPWKGEIADLEVDAIVIPALESLWMTSGVAAAVKRRGGEALETAAVALGPIEPGRAVVTEGGPLAAEFVAHAVDVGHDLRGDPGRVVAALRDALAQLTSLGARRIATALLGAERGTFPPEEAAELVLTAVEQHDAAFPGSLELVFVAATTDAELSAVAGRLQARRAAR
jgi:O-acetyl-ADP-ribose deacetylase (regulator of RNase III)